MKLGKSGFPLIGMSGNTGRCSGIVIGDKAIVNDGRGCPLMRLSFSSTNSPSSSGSSPPPLSLSPSDAAAPLLSVSKHKKSVSSGVLMFREKLSCTCIVSDQSSFSKVCCHNFSGEAKFMYREVWHLASLPTRNAKSSLTNTLTTRLSLTAYRTIQWVNYALNA